MTTTAETTEQDKKYCKYCRRLRPITDFRFHYKAKGIRHSECNTCRRERDQKHRENKRTQSARRGIQNLRRLKTLEAMRNWLELLFYKAGGVEALADVWIKLLKSETVPPSYRITALATLVHLAEVYDLTHASVNKVESAEDLKRLPKEKLIYLIRQLRNEGYLSIDDVDPAPDDIEQAPFEWIPDDCAQR